MRTRTKVSILLFIMFLAAFGVAGGVVGMGLVAQTMKLIFFDAALLSGLLGTGAAIFGTTSVITGAIKRRNAERVQAESVARMVENYQGNVKSHENIQKLSNDFTQSYAYSVENNQSGLIGRRGIIGETTEQTKARNEVEAYMGRRNYYNSIEKGGNKQSKYYDKKVINAKRKLINLNNNMGPIDRRYSYTAEIPDPFNGQVYYDHRNEIMCNSSETLEKFKKVVMSDTLRTNKKYYKDFGYASTLMFATNETLKDICVKSNVEENMDNYELMLLNEVKSEVEKLQSSQGVFPIRIKREHYTSHNKSQSNIFVILSMEDLEKRIENMEKYATKDPEIKVSGKHFIDRQYKNVQIVDEVVDTDEIVK